MSEKDITEWARVTSHLIRAHHQLLSEMRFRESPRERLALTLLLASLDHAESSAVLLATDPLAHGVSAVALFRPQLEAFCRAVMFSQPAEVSDAEIQAFINDDKLPKRTNPDGKRVPIWFEAVSDIALKEMNKHARGWGDSAHEEPLKTFLNFDRKELHGFIHGGKVLVHMYQYGLNGIGFSLSDNSARQFMLHVGRLAQLAFSFATDLLAIDTSKVDVNPLAKTWPEFSQKVAGTTVAPFRLGASDEIT